MQRSPYYPYPPRPGICSEAIDLNMDGVGEPKLAGDALERVLVFESELYNASLDSAQFPRSEAFRRESEAAGTPVLPLERVWQKKINSTQLGTSYFLTEEGREALRRATGLSISFQEPEGCARILSSLDTSGVDSKTLDDLEAKSIGHEEARLTEAFISGGFSGQNLLAPNIVTIYKNPDVILEKVRGYRQFKAYLRYAKSDLATTSINGNRIENTAQQIIADLYRSRVNNFIAALYVDAYKLLAWQSASGSSRYGETIVELEKSLPGFSSRADNSSVANYLQRMDRYRHGVSQDEQNELTWLSPEAKRLAESPHQTNEVSADVNRFMYGEIEPSRLDEAEVSGEEFGSWVRDVLQEYDLLSCHDEWDSERECPAPDGKWQVVVSDKFKSLSVNYKQQVVKIASKPSSVRSTIARSSHEIAHVIQHHNKRALGRLAILEKIGLDNVSEQTEAGAKWQEKLANEILSGKPDTDVAGTSYYKALLIKARGGSFGECVQAYFEDLRERNPEAIHNKLAAQAVNRARRIFRSGGFEFAQGMPILTNTQTLNYLEQQLIYRGLPEQQRHLLFMGGVSLSSLSKLSRIGLVDARKIYLPSRAPWEILYPKAKVLMKSES